MRTIRITLFALFLISANGLASKNILDESNPRMDACTESTVATDYYTRLYYLCKAWGHAKYYHSEIAAGNVNWDDALLTAIVGVKAAVSDADFNSVVLQMLNSAGTSTSSGVDLPEVPDSLNNILDRNWMYDPIFSGAVTSELETIWNVFGPQSNVYITSGSTQPKFEDDTLYYSGADYPNEEFRLLALFRYWNIIQYFYPNKKIADQDWDASLIEFLPAIVDATDALSYNLALKQLIALLNDTNTYMYGPVHSQWQGEYYPPFNIRFIEGETVITKVLNGTTGLAPGDIITEIDGEDIYTLRNNLAPFANASNDVALERIINSFIIWGDNGNFNLSVDKGGGNIYSGTLLRNDVNYDLLKETTDPRWHIENSSNGCQIGIVDMSRLTTGIVDDMFADLWDTDMIIFDHRISAIGAAQSIFKYLHHTSANTANFTVPSKTYPGEMTWKYQWIGASKPTPYDGQVVLLFDERAQGHVEWSCMVIGAYAEVTKIGSTTAGADGNLAWLKLPGNITVRATMLGTFYPDFTPAQRAGIIPDFEVLPTIDGIRNGIDEVLSYALDSIFNCTPDGPCGSQIDFDANPLTHSGLGWDTTAVDFDPSAGYPSFTISDIGQNTKGAPQSRYIDILEVRFVYADGDTIFHYYSGANVSTVNVEVFDSVQFMSVSLSNGYSGNTAPVSVTLSPVSYCIDCNDSDGDGVCDDVDICSGGDDNIDTDGDGVPDYCDNCPNTANPNQADSDNNGTGDACEPSGCASPVTSNLNPNPLTHSGPSSSTATLNLGSSNTDITFTISGINQKTNGNPSKRYIEEVVVDVDGQFFAQYSGSQVSSADVSIPGPAQLIEVTLYDSYDGDVQSGSMSIDFTAVSSCAASSAPLSDWSDEVQTFDDGDLDVRLYPNPSSGKAYVEFTTTPGQGHITVRDILGRSITQKEVSGDKIVEIDLSHYTAPQILFVTVEIEGELLRTMKLIIVE